MSTNQPNKRFQILDETVIRRGEPGPQPSADEGEAINPYWTFGEDAPHPDPSKGCIRRGLCCRSSPGWFVPGQVEKAAEYMGMSPDAFVREHLVVDSLEVDGEKVYTFAPVKLDRMGKPAWETGRPVDRLYRELRGVCVFFKGDGEGGGCGIYPVRPLECERYICTNAPEDNLGHGEIARMWKAGAVANDEANDGANDGASHGNGGAPSDV